MLQLRYAIDGEERILPLSAAEVHFGRSGDNEVVLPDYSVSRRHAVVRRAGERWLIHDLHSTNGVQINQSFVESAQIRGGDRLKIGVFEILVEEGDELSGSIDPGAPTEFSSTTMRAREVPGATDQTPMPAPARPTTPRASGPPPIQLPSEDSSISGLLEGSAISHATIVRPLSDIFTEYGLDESKPLQDSGVIRQSKREALDQAYASKVFGWLAKLARTLINTDSDDEILEQVMAIAFEILPVDRGFILLRDQETGELECELVRIEDKIEVRPTGAVPISKKILEEVIRERVAMLTYDALSDRRLAGTESVRIHQIRAAMCAPLWAEEKIFGVMQVDTPHHTGSFTEPDVDLLATLTNYCAVAIERNRHAREAESERAIRTRLERYHSPAVIEDFMKSSGEDDEGVRSLKQAEVTVLFADIVGFTAFSENAEPAEVAELMEGYFTHAVEAIFDAGGTLDKFIGDSVMAFFGAPVAQPDHASRAVETAIRICAALDGWNDERRQRGLREIAIRVGINSGPVVVGDIGSKKRVDYTVLGNTVNVAARLEESVAKPGDIVIGDATFRQLDGKIPTEPLGEVALKGLTQRIPAYRVVRA